MKKMYFDLGRSLFFILVLSGCSDIGYIKYIMEYQNDSSKILNLQLNDSVEVAITFNKHGAIESFKNDIPESRTQYLTFHTNGFLKTKEILHSEIGRVGRLYTFDNEFGRLIGDYGYVNGKRYGSGLEYHQGTRRVSKILLYGENSELEYFKKFDESGKLIEQYGTPWYD